MIERERKAIQTDTFNKERDRGCERRHNHNNNNNNKNYSSRKKQD